MIINNFFGRLLSQVGLFTSNTTVEMFFPNLCVTSVVID